MKIYLLTVGHKMPAWVVAGYSDYAQRLRGEITLEMQEIALAKRSRNANTEQLTLKEGESMLAAIPARAYVLALDVCGKPWSTEALANEVQTWMAMGRDVVLLVGGPDGLSEMCLARADARWSLSNLTFPHPLVRIIIAEQLYRAVSWLRNHPYHRSA